MADAPAPAERRATPLEEHPAPLGVREQDVVVLGQEADGRRRLRIGPRRVGQVEELAAVLVAEGPQARPEALDDLAQPGQPAPGRHVGDGRRAERGEVPEHDVVERRPARERTAEPRLGGREPDLRRRAPDAAGRHLDEREPAATGEGERRRVAARGTARPAPRGARCPTAAAPRAPRPRTRARARGRRPRGPAPRPGAVAARRPARAASAAGAGGSPRR